MNRQTPTSSPEVCPQVGAVAAGKPLNGQLSLWAPPPSGARLRGHAGGVEAQFLRREGLRMQSGEVREGHSCSAQVSSSLRTPRSPWSRGQGCRQWPLGSGTGSCRRQAPSWQPALREAPHRARWLLL